MEPCLSTFVTQKNRQKWIRGKKIMTPQNKIRGSFLQKKFSIKQFITYLKKGVIFTKKFLIKQLVTYFQTSQKKSLNIILLPLELQDDL
jgi:hypothetical protein